jgi:hypothetical protein
MKVPLLDLRAQHESLRDELLAAMRSVIDSQQFVLGPDVQAFEDEIARLKSNSSMLWMLLVAFRPRALPRLGSPIALAPGLGDKEDS